MTVFTVMPTGRPPGLSVRGNRYDWTRRRFGRPQVVAGTDIVDVIGGVAPVDAPAYLDAVTSLASGGGPVLRPLSRTMPLAEIARHRPHGGAARMLEIELRRGPSPSRWWASSSAVGYTLPVVLASVSSRAAGAGGTLLLRPGVGTRARSFPHHDQENQTGAAVARNAGSPPLKVRS
ncbi:MAG: hypothetical protein KIT69_02030 [Propionibacteriaceae bacterium]|nr:hypothetical protein [Propionibacteriaceae bacterium]